MTKKETKQITISINEDDNYYISDILCWLEGFLAAKGDDFKDYYLLMDAVERLTKINEQIKNQK